jgi:uncharacterized protein (DUF1697 family)
MRYAAFLRAINLGKLNRIRMEELRNLCSSLGWEEIRTHLQTGNIAFDHGEKNAEVIAQELEAKLLGLGHSGVGVFVRTESEIRKMLEHAIFAERDLSIEYHYLTLLRTPPEIIPIIPTSTGLEVLHADNGAVLSVVARDWPKTIQPNAIIERKWKVSATTRFFNVLEAFVEIL